MSLSHLHALFVCLILAVAVSASADDQELPRVFQDDFESGSDHWQPTDESAWKIKETSDGHVYSQFKTKSNYTPPHRSPLNISLLKNVYVEDFQLDVKVLSTHADYGHRDVCLFFGYQNPAQFYYVHLGKKTDDHANQIFIVNEQPRAKISLKTTAGTDWDDNWHQVRIVRKVTRGTIEVYFDEMSEPVMVANDSTFGWGQVGLGSFDDTSDWDDFSLHGFETKKP